MIFGKKLYQSTGYIMGIFRLAMVLFSSAFKNVPKRLEDKDETDFCHRVRGELYLAKGKGDLFDCNGCGLCVINCPSKCISISMDENDSSKLKSFEVDLFRCIRCGFCQEACPEDAIRWR